MKIVLCGVGSHGDVQPLLGLGRALVARDHDVTLCAAVNYEAVVNRAGLRFASIGTSMEQLVKDEGEKVFNPFHFIDLAKGLAAEQLKNALAATDGADLIVGGAACIVGRTVAELQGARFCWAAFAPGTFPTSQAPFLLTGIGPDRRWLNRMSHSVGNATLARVLMRVMNPLRKEHGLQPVRNYDDAVLDACALYAVDAHVDPMPSDWRVARAHQTGFWFYDDGAAFPDDVARFLDDGDAPVYVGFGSMPVKDPAARTRAIVQGLVESGQRGLLSAGWGGLGADVELPPTILRIGSVPHARLFPRCKAVVHHCGAGTTAAAARAGVPQIPVPHAFDQPTWARCLRERGVAAVTLPRDFDGKALAAAVRATVDDAGVNARARDLGAALAAVDGARDAAVWLEQTCVGADADTTSALGGLVEDRQQLRRLV